MNTPDIDRVLSEAASRLGARPEDAMTREIEQRLISDLRPVRPMASERQLSLAMAAAFLIVLGFGVWRLGTSGYFAMTHIEAWSMFGGLAGASAVMAGSLSKQMAPGSRHRIEPAVLPWALLAVMFAIVVAVFTAHREPGFWPAAWVCFTVGLPYAVAVAIPFVLLLRRGAVLAPRWTGAAAGLFAGFTGTSVLEIYCPNLNLWHRMVGHLGVALFTTLAGLAVGWVLEAAARRTQ